MHPARLPLLMLTLVAVGGDLVAQGRPGRPSERMPGPRTERPVVVQPSTPRPGADRPVRTPSFAPRTDPSRPMPTRGADTPIVPRTRDIQIPRPLPRCTVRPDRAFWRHRDILEEIQFMARQGVIRVKPVQDDQNEVLGSSDFPAGWIAYGFRVPPGAKLHVRLHHTNEGWFRLMMVNKWGRLEEGMLQNLIPTGNPEVKYTNPTKEARNVYVIVDDPGWMSTEANPFKLVVTRSWDPAKVPMDQPLVQGIWAEKKEDPAAPKTEVPKEPVPETAKG